jgi:hypothetical protein
VTSFSQQKERRGKHRGVRGENFCENRGNKKPSPSFGKDTVLESKKEEERQYKTKTYRKQ